MILDVAKVYSDYAMSYDELCLYDDEYRIAGTTDKLLCISKRKDGMVDISDYKTNLKKGIEFFSQYKKRLYAPLDHLEDCNFVKYSLQLTGYAYMFEKLTGRRVRKLFIHFIPPDNPMAHYRIPVMYMKNDFKLILEAYKYHIQSALSTNLPPAF